MVRAPTLVVMAAGGSTRFGDAKQIVPIDADGSWLLDHTIANAGEAGIRDVVIVARPDLHLEILAHTTEREMRWAYSGARVRQVRIQHEPTGTVAAIVAAELNGPIIIANADDHYGVDAMRQARWLAERDWWGTVTFELEQCAPTVGTVNRGLCEIQGGRLLSINEILVERQGDRFESAVLRDRFELAQPTAMNLFSFPAGHLEVLADRRLTKHDASVADALNVAAEKHAVLARPSDSRVVGLTWPDDLDWVRRLFQPKALVDA